MRLMSAAPRGVAANRRSSATTCGRRLVISSRASSASASVNVSSSPLSWVRFLSAGSKSEAPGVELEPPEITVLMRKSRTTFDAFARALQAVGAEAVRASDAQDAAALLDIGGRMQDVCESCHQVFWYPGAKQPGAARNQPAKK